MADELTDIPTPTLPQVLDLLKQIVTDKGLEYMYPNEDKRNLGALIEPEPRDLTCVYLNDAREPSCIIGHLAYRLGVPKETIALFEGSDAIQLFGDLWPDIDPVICAVVSNAQSAQDSDTPWGEVLDQAIESADILSAHAAAGFPVL